MEPEPDRLVLVIVEDTDEDSLEELVEALTDEG
jgi:hypothetical protein